MKTHDPKDQLAAWTDHTLGQLPPRPAPQGFAARVMAVIAQQRALPWYRQPWFFWPRRYQLLAGAFALALVGLIGWLFPSADSVSLAAAAETAAQLEVVRPVTTTVSLLETIGGALVTVLKSLSGWTLAAVVGGVAFLWCSTLGLGTACWRLAVSSR